MGNFFLFSIKEEKTFSNLNFFTGGSPIYWSYEQGKAFEAALQNVSLASTLDIDIHTDIYSFGLIIKEIIYGGLRPWRVGHEIDHLIGEKKYFCNKILPQALEILNSIAEKCLKKRFLVFFIKKNYLFMFKRPLERPTTKCLLLDLVENYMIVFPSDKEVLWRPFVNLIN